MSGNLWFNNKRKSDITNRLFLFKGGIWKACAYTLKCISVKPDHEGESKLCPNPIVIATKE